MQFSLVSDLIIITFKSKRWGGGQQDGNHEQKRFHFSCHCHLGTIQTAFTTCDTESWRKPYRAPEGLGPQKSRPWTTEAGITFWRMAQSRQPRAEDCLLLLIRNYANGTR
jgi:hypothetical protein